MDLQLRAPEGRCPGPSYLDIAAKDGGAVPEPLSLEANPPQPTTDISFERYTSQAFFDAEMQKMWRRVWQYACRDEHLPEPGDFYVYDIGRRSILIVRQEDGSLRAFHNSCLHRGTKLKASGSNGWSPHVACPFHGWTWNWDGSINNIPCKWDFPHVDADSSQLPQVQVDSWNGFVFINMDPQAQPLLDYLEVIPEHWKRWDMTGWYVHTHVRKALPGNWKLGQEAFMEAYHTPVAHPEMTHVVGDHNMQHDIFSDHVTRDLCPMASPSPTSKMNLSEQDLLDRMLVSDRAVVAEKRLVPEGKSARWVMAQQMRDTMQTDYGLDFSHLSDPEMIDSIKYHLFPNVFLYGGVALRLIQQFRPIDNDPDRCWFDQMVFRPKPADGSEPEVAEVVEIGENDSYGTVPGMDPFLASVLDQDTDIMRWQREGMYASEKGAETLARYQEARIRHVHETLDKYLNA